MKILKKKEIIKIEATTRYLNTLMNAVEETRSGKLPPNKLKEFVEQMRKRIDEITEDFPSISKDLEELKKVEGLDPVELMENGLDIYKKAFNILNLFLTDSKSEHLEEGLKTVKEAHEKFVTIQEFLSKVTGI